MSGALEEMVGAVAHYVGPDWSERDGIYYPLEVTRVNNAVFLRCGHVKRTVNGSFRRQDDLVNHIEGIFRAITTTYRRAVSDQGEV